MFISKEVTKFFTFHLSCCAGYTLIRGYINRQLKISFPCDDNMNGWLMYPPAYSSVVVEAMTAEAKAKAKAIVSESKAKAKATASEAEAKAKDLPPRPRPRPRPVLNF